MEIFSVEQKILYKNVVFQSCKFVSFGNKQFIAEDQKSYVKYIKKTKMIQARFRLEKIARLHWLVFIGQQLKLKRAFAKQRSTWEITHLTMYIYIWTYEPKCIRALNCSAC